MRSRTATPQQKQHRSDIAPLQLVLFTVCSLSFFTRQFLRGDIVLGGDTQLLWSLDSLALQTLRGFGEFLWWDPTAINGWPGYVNLTAGWFNYCLALYAAVTRPVPARDRIRHSD